LELGRQQKHGDSSGRLKKEKGNMSCMITMGDWEKHCSELLMENQPEYRVMATPPPLEDRKLIITKEEVRVTVNNMKNNRAQEQQSCQQNY
jgi:hypothetical protein